MAKAAVRWVCRECGTHAPVELGRCPGCGAWDAMDAERPAGRARASETAEAVDVVALDAVDELALRRTASGDPEVDRVLGGGWVAGSAVLLAGEPGIGKSTLLLQLARHAAQDGGSVLYVAGEESLGQIKLRAQRLGAHAPVALTRAVDARALAEHVQRERPGLVIVDSIQTLVADDDGTPGSLTQVRDATALLVRAGKAADATLVLIGHVTKQGSIAGPKVVEHMVDATLAMESASGFRVLRANKNRFGAAGEVGVFRMVADGLRPVPNPSAAFLAERPADAAGSVVLAALEGQRPLLLEVQALASKSPYASPRRVVQGLEARRVDMVLAVLERRLQLPLEGLDVFVNVAGGLRLTDPGADAAVALATYSAITNRPWPAEVAVVGEVGLAGEVRSVPQLARRAQEAQRAGHPRLIGPRSDEADVEPVTTLREAIQRVWGGA